MIKGNGKVVTITRKMRGTGNRFDLEHDRFDHVIYLSVPGAPCKYAVVLPACYGCRRTTTHRTLNGAIKSARRFRRNGYENVTILDGYGKIINLFGSLSS